MVLREYLEVVFIGFLSTRPISYSGSLLEKTKSEAMMQDYQFLILKYILAKGIKK